MDKHAAAEDPQALLRQVRGQLQGFRVQGQNSINVIYIVFMYSVILLFIISLSYIDYSCEPPTKMRCNCI